MGLLSAENDDQELPGPVPELSGRATSRAATPRRAGRPERRGELDSDKGWVEGMKVSGWGQITGERPRRTW
jgi:hypothetical protein